MSLVNAIGNNDISAMGGLAADKGNSDKETVREMFSQLLQDKKVQYFTRIKSGSSEQSFQIGAGSYTETEWKKLLKNFDAAENQLREEAEGTKKEVQETNPIATSDEDKESKEKVWIYRTI